MAHYGVQSERVHTLQQLLKAYTMFNKDDEAGHQGIVFGLVVFLGRLMIEINLFEHGYAPFAAGLRGLLPSPEPICSAWAAR